MLELRTLAKHKLSLLADHLYRLQVNFKGVFAENHLKISFCLFIIVIFQIISVVLRDVFEFPVSAFLSVFLLWFFVGGVFGYSGVKSMTTGIIFLLFSVFFMMFGATGIADQGANIAFLFLVFGFLQLFINMLFSLNRKEV